MKNSLLIFPFLFGSFLLQAQNSIKIEIDNFESNQGVVLIALFDTESSFLKHPFQKGRLEIANKKAFHVFTDVPDGIYAISLVHDEDENNELTKNFLGIPKEGYGASNNAPAKLGAPKWMDARFEVRDGQTVKQKIGLKKF